MLTDFWESQTLIKMLYSKCIEPVCKLHGLTRMELDILLFLANNPQFDTAADIIERRKLTKSHVSTSIKSLEERGFITKTCIPENRKNIHLSLCDSAANVISQGRQAQKQFVSIILKDFSEQDRETLKLFFPRISGNIRTYLKEDSK